MLTLSRRKGEELLIGDDVVVRVVDIDGGKVNLGIDAPKDVMIRRVDRVTGRPVTTRARPTRVCLCGSTRFRAAYEEAAARETLAGKIVLSVGLFGHETGLDMDGPVKAMLDELHLRKIDAADEVLVIDVPRPACVACGQSLTNYARTAGGDDKSLCCDAVVVLRPYLGESTRRELEYATAHAKRIRYLSKETSP